MNLDSDTVSSMQVYEGKFYYPDSPSSNRIHKESKHFVFDLDETLGSFSELYMLWTGIAHLYQEDTGDLFVESQDSMNHIMELYPEFLRYGIMTILEFLHYKKRNGHFGNVYIYTNNVCSKSWATMIIRYIESKGNLEGLFDQIIGAFKINRLIIEPNRTSSTKSVQDLIRCTLLPKTAEICFIDNTYFPKMKNPRVFYIQPKAYYHTLSIDQIIGRFVSSDIGIQMSNQNASWEKRLFDWFIHHGYFVGPRMKSRCERDLDIQVSKKLMYHIKEFFYLAIYRPKTQKVRSKYWYNVSKKNRRIS
jgi:hypothetical protein